jgi:HK97 family phage portal protein
MAVEEFGVRFFSNGTNIGGFIEFPGSVKKDALDRIKTSINENYSGLRKSHGIMILEEGAKFEKLGMPLEDAQFIESRKFTATEIARIHGVPPHMIGDLERATFSNVEEQGLDAVRYLFRPWAVRWEQALNIKLFGETDRERFYVKFELDGLMRGNMKARYDAYSVGLQQGILCVDEARGFEDLPPLPNGEGKIHRFPLNLGEAGKGVKSEN